MLSDPITGIIIPTPAPSRTTPSEETPTPTPTPTVTPTPILLNNFTSFLSGSGQTLYDLSEGQAVSFDTAGGVSNTATITEIGGDYVVITLATVPSGVHLNLGETKKIDVNGDGVNDIQMTLNSIIDGKADITFLQLTTANVTTLPKTGVTTTPIVTPTPVGTGSTVAVWWCAGLLVLSLLGVGAYFVYNKKHDGHK